MHVSSQFLIIKLGQLVNINKIAHNIIRKLIVYHLVHYALASGDSVINLILVISLEFPLTITPSLKLRHLVNINKMANNA